MAGADFQGMNAQSGIHFTLQGEIAMRSIVGFGRSMLAICLSLLCVTAGIAQTPPGAPVVYESLIPVPARANSVVVPEGSATTTFSFTGAAQSYVVPAGVTQIRILARGAQGGDVIAASGADEGGLGATMQGDFAVIPGTTLTVVVGGKGNPELYTSGGGGASGVSNGSTPLIVAGAGAGVDFQNTNYIGKNAVTTQNGQPGNAGGGAGGTAGGNGGDYVYAGNNFSRGGRGFLAGASGSQGANGSSPNTSTTLGTFGLGGGGGSVGSGWCNCGAGGGGYSGGGAGNINTSGGGGGSFNSGTNQVNTAGDNAGNGIVAITVLTQVASANLAITKTDGATTEYSGTPVTYTIMASNTGPSPVESATVTDTFPSTIVGVTWTCVGVGGGTCAASGSGNINQSVNLPVGGSVTFTATGTIAAGASGTLTNTATVSSTTSDPDSSNNSATDVNTLVRRRVVPGG